jgi:murein DD-endopeptidase MepM/ murein hydrolase activator NlpD
MPGGYMGGWYGDTGVDIAGRYLGVYAIASGTLEYSEWGHTLWTGKGDTPYSVRIRLDEPIAVDGHKVTHVYYTHLSDVVTTQKEGSSMAKHVIAGERIGTSGIGNHVPHLHMGLLLDNEVEQDSWEFILREDAVRKVMGGYKNGELLKAMPPPATSRVTSPLTSSSALAPSPRRGS